MIPLHVLPNPVPVFEFWDTAYASIRCDVLERKFTPFTDRVLYCGRCGKQHFEWSNCICNSFEECDHCGGWTFHYYLRDGK